MIEKWRKPLDEGGAFEAILTDHSKAFDFLSYELLIVSFMLWGRYPFFKTIAPILD